MTTASRRSGIVLRDVRLVSTEGSSGRRCDVAIRDGRVESILPPHSAHARSDQEVINLDGRFLLPGLWDHHVHFSQWAEVQQRVDLSSCASARATAEDVAAHFLTGNYLAGSPLIGYGFRDGLWPDLPETALLDAAAPGTPVILISADLHCAWLSSSALRMLNVTAHQADGLLREDECRPVRDFLRRRANDREEVAVLAAAQAAAARGVVGVVDLEIDFNLENWTRRVQAGNRYLRVSCGVWEEHLDDAISRGLRTGDVLPGTDGLVSMGSFKVSLDGSLNTRTAYCYDPYPGPDRTDSHGVMLVSSDRLTTLMRNATQHGIDCAVHAIGDHANTLALDAFERVSAQGTIEHAQLLAPRDIDRFANLGVAASVQPAHAITDQDVAQRYWPGRTSRAYPFRSLLEAGATVVFGSDAPVSPLDPWVTAAAAVERSRPGQPPWHPEQSLNIREALRSSTRGRCEVQVQDVADLVVTEHDPLDLRPSELATMPVYGTLLAGEWTWRRP